MALDLPVIVSDLEIFHEVVGDGGILVPPNDVLQVAEWIKTIGSNLDLASGLGQKTGEELFQSSVSKEL